VEKDEVYGDGWWRVSGATERDRRNLERA
jgi:hypothetical protein